MRIEQGCGAEGLRGLHAGQAAGDPAQVPAQQTGEVDDRQRTAVLAGGGQGLLEQGGPRQRPGAVVDRDDVEAPGVHVVGEGPERVPLGGVPRGAAGHEQHLAVAEQRCDRLPDAVLVALPDDDHQPLEVRYAERREHGLAQDRAVAQRQQHLVGLRADPAAGACGEDHDGGGHGTNCYTAVAQQASGETRRP